MKHVLMIAMMTLISFSASAKTEELTAKCQAVAEKAAEKANYKKFGAETSVCGSKVLHLGDQLETYLVCISDETDPSEWIVTVKRDVFNKDHDLVKNCKVEYTGYAVDAATPNFDN